MENWKEYRQIATLSFCVCLYSVIRKPLRLVAIGHVGMCGVSAPHRSDPVHPRFGARNPDVAVAPLEGGGPATCARPP